MGGGNWQEVIGWVLGEEGKGEGWMRELKEERRKEEEKEIGREVGEKKGDREREGEGRREEGREEVVRIKERGMEKRDRRMGRMMERARGNGSTWRMRVCVRDGKGVNVSVTTLTDTIEILVIS